MGNVPRIPGACATRNFTYLARGPLHEVFKDDTVPANNGNTLRLRLNCCHFADDIFKCIFLNENMWISMKMSLKYVPKVRINNIPSLVQKMAGVGSFLRGFSAICLFQQWLPVRWNVHRFPFKLWQLTPLLRTTYHLRPLWGWSFLRGFFAICLVSSVAAC